MKQITLENLHCTSTEDWTGADECRLEVYNDGELHFAYRKDLNDDENWALNASLLFARTCVLRLFDEDGDFPGDDDDALGVVTIGPEDAAHATARFTGDDADYTIHNIVDEASFDALTQCGIPGEVGRRVRHTEATPSRAGLRTETHPRTALASRPSSSGLQHGQHRPRGPQSGEVVRPQTLGIPDH